MTAFWFVFLCGLAIGAGVGLIVGFMVGRERRVYGRMVEFTRKPLG